MKACDNEGPGFFQRYRIVIGVGIAVSILAVFAVAVFFAFSTHSTKPRQLQEIVVHLEPPPPLPPPPSQPTPPPEQKMVEQPPVKPNEQKPRDEPKPLDKPPGPPGPVASGPPSDFGLAGGGGGGGGYGGSDGGSRWGWYAAQVQNAIGEALRRNDKTREARLHLKVMVWADSSGRITQAKLGGASGDPSVDEVLKNQVLTGLTLPEPPPSDMPMPIVLGINAQRPQ
ncbi:MAG: TonB C-terminal domain-containing protein [Methylacidiphilales bacterium]|nr:TonB C-terminal domain-containing protein [Candidatus Methylacidiphilales bacterium]